MIVKAESRQLSKLRNTHVILCFLNSFLLQADHGITEWKPKKKQVKKKVQESRFVSDKLQDAKIKPCRVMIKKVKMEKEKNVDLEVSSVWKNILGGMKKRKISETENEERIISPKKSVKKRKTSDFIKEVRAPLSLLNWVTQNPNMTL